MIMDQPYLRRTVAGNVVSSFDHEIRGPLGVGQKRSLMVNMDRYIDHSMDDELHWEACRGLALSETQKMGMFIGPVPPEIRKRTGCGEGWAEMIRNIEDHDPTGIHGRNLELVASAAPKGQELQAMYRYAYFAMGASIPWFFAIYLKTNSFGTKTMDQGSWTEAARNFPRIVEYVQTLPMSVIGRVLFFTTFPNAGVTVHRDGPVAEHKDHNINLFFSGGWRPSFIYDETNGEKHHLDPNARSYFSNNRDYHGVDPTPEFRYTLRVDGTFNKDICDELGLIDGYTWKWDYLR